MAETLVAACLVVRDEEKLLAACLEAVAPLVDEVVVADTGSRDRTIAVAVERGSVVHRIPWSDDFAAARNQACAACASPWVLQVDADEVVHAGHRDAVRSLVTSTTADAFLVGRYNHTTDHAGGGGFTSWHARLYRAERWRWEGQVHEQLVGSSAPPVPTDAMWLEHHGYRPTRYQARAKRARDEALARLDLEAHPGSWRARFELARACADPVERAEHFGDLAADLESAPQGTLGAEALLGLAGARWHDGDRSGAVAAATGAARRAPPAVAARYALAAIGSEGDDLLGAALALATAAADDRAVHELRRLTPGMGP